MTKLDEFDYKLIEKLVPWLLVYYEVDTLYLKEPERAINLIMDKLDEEAILDQKNIMIVSCEFQAKKEKFIGYLNKVSEDEFLENNKMFLFEAVSIFESGINSWFHNELIISFDLSHQLVNKILAKLSFEDKLGWFLKIITGEAFTTQKSWLTIKQIITSRNKFIHFKPTDVRQYFLHENNLSKESILSFLEACSTCYSFLEARKGKEVVNYNERIQRITEVYKKRHAN